MNSALVNNCSQCKQHFQTSVIHLWSKSIIFKNKLPTSPCCLAYVYFQIFVLITEFFTVVSNLPAQQWMGYSICEATVVLPLASSSEQSMTVFGSRSCEFKPQVVQNEHCCQLSCLPILLFVAQNCLNLPKNSPDPTHRCAAAIIIIVIINAVFRPNSIKILFTHKVNDKKLDTNTCLFRAGGTNDVIEAMAPKMQQVSNLVSRKC